ncbi:TIGR03862 family flavoprotein [Sneathiella sp. P13V-1]|uniref:TIGR03862 family flavoprotein n=1 Tax=Sneathiella sp. P13V-1 TaxID=2697366 RepID=UPI00187B795F|nr:TIGR03862 family flavoprotein [Sneathiella sp. P13V-1]MBE7637039.1 TIGR03862 family flavoprotein [Sneathiella sp. P13V-1]
MKSVAIIGGGPAGLMAAYFLCQNKNLNITVYEQKPSVGRKFLIAGRGGLNLTNAEDLEFFLNRYEKATPFMAPHIQNFTPQDLQNWANDLGVETFTGSSGRVFPVKMKATSLMRAWTKYLSGANVQFKLSTTFTGLGDDGTLQFKDKDNTLFFDNPDAVLLSCGGASYKHLGATGEWVDAIKGFDLVCNPFAPINCGYRVDWSNHILPTFEGEPLKNVAVSLNGKVGRGDLIISKSGLEGGAIYAISIEVTKQLQISKPVHLSLDLRPDQTAEELQEKLSKRRKKDSLSNYLRKRLKLSSLEVSLLNEFTDRDRFQDPSYIAASIKNLQIPILDTAPMDRAISVMGGLDLSELDENLMIRKNPGWFAAGEMLDWQAPTGGYLLQGCFSTGVSAAKGILRWLDA